MKKNNNFLTLRATLSLLLVFFITATVEARPSDKWRLHVNGSANSDGTIVVSVQPVGGTPIAVQTQIEDGTRENMVAKEITKAMKAQLSDDFKISRDDGEEVKINARMGRADFELEVVSNTVKGVRVTTDRK